MIRGAAIFAVGFGVGYVKAMSDQDSVREAARVFINFVNDIAVEEDVKRRKAADEAVEGEKLRDAARRAREVGAEELRVTQEGTGATALVDVDEVLGPEEPVVEPDDAETDEGETS